MAPCTCSDCCDLWDHENTEVTIKGPFEQLLGPEEAPSDVMTWLANVKDRELEGTHTGYGIVEVDIPTKGKVYFYIAALRPRWWFPRVLNDDRICVQCTTKCTNAARPPGVSKVPAFWKNWTT